MTPTELRELRKELGLTQLDAAQRLGLSTRGYRYHEEGRTSRGAHEATVPPVLAAAMLGLRLAYHADRPTALAEFLAAMQKGGLAP